MTGDDVRDWQYEVANGDTVLGLQEWYEHKMEAEAHDLQHDHGIVTILPSATCVVVIGKNPLGSLADDTDYMRCPEPAAGERGGYPMCADHLDEFKPDDRPEDSPADPPYDLR